MRSRTMQPEYKLMAVCDRRDLQHWKQVVNAIYMRI